MKYIYPILLFLLFLGCSKTAEIENETPLEIWFNQPTTKWDEGLPIGNGSLGSMIYGTPAKEIICLNEETIWSGEKKYNDKKNGNKALGEIRQLLFDGEYIEAESVVAEKLLSKRLPSGTNSNQMLANLFIENADLDSLLNYRRELDLNQSIVTTSYEKNGVKYKNECFSSFPDKVMVLKYSADKDQSISFSARIKRTENTKIEFAGNVINFSEHVGNGVGVKFHATIHFETKGGKSQVKDGKLVITDANEVIIRITAVSDYRGGDPRVLCLQNLDHALSLDYDQLQEKHIADYRSLFKRVDLHLSDNDGYDLPTNERLKKVKKGGFDNYLSQLQYQFGRYLLISSSRPGTLPANLQGIWVNGLTPPWNSDYHININIQMNYWMAEMANLSECHEPFLDFIGDLREMGRITAKETYGCGGFVAHHTSDVWHNTFGFGRARYGMWPMGAAWCCQHLYTHFEFTEDKEYLKNYAYPVMKEAAQFFVDFMVPDPKTGLLVTGPSVSPENSFLDKNGKMATISMGSTMDREIIFELFQNCISSADILGIDKEFSQILQSKIEQMPPLQIGSDGRLMEWVEEFKEENEGHRHISHLYALHPSNQISKTKTPKLFEAAKKTIEHRLANGGGHTGWSRAWIINFWARLLESEKAHENIVALQKKSTLPNLLDKHPPFQIDGNFGLVSGITEMLMQSHEGEINLLPALPKAWVNGSINGIVARKGFKVDIEWKEGQLESLVIHSRLGNVLQLRYGKTVKSFDTEVGEVLRFNNELLKF